MVRKVTHRADHHQARVLIKQWRKEYNQVRPHSARNNRPPAPEAVLVNLTT
ncbi:integrase core domain-containing protein [Chloroflexota bacterium]